MTGRRPWTPPCGSRRAAPAPTGAEGPLADETARHLSAARGCHCPRLHAARRVISAACCQAIQPGQAGSSPGGRDAEPVPDGGTGRRGSRTPALSPPPGSRAAGRADIPGSVPPHPGTRIPVDERCRVPPADPLRRPFEPGHNPLRRRPVPPRPDTGRDGPAARRRDAVQPRQNRNRPRDRVLMQPAAPPGPARPGL